VKVLVTGAINSHKVSTGSSDYLIDFSTTCLFYLQLLQHSLEGFVKIATGSRKSGVGANEQLKTYK
jgi:hypothetical protein